MVVVVVVVVCVCVCVVVVVVVVLGGYVFLLLLHFIQVYRLCT